MRTITKDQLSRYSQTAQERDRQRQLTATERTDYQALMDRIVQAARLLKSRFGAQKVILFGSLAHQAWYSSESDVDLAVEGIPAQDYFLAWGVVEDLITNRRVDFIDLQDASTSLREAIMKHGVEL